MSKEAIVDCETLGKTDHAVILSIGIIIADTSKSYSFDDLMKEGLYIKLNVDEQVKLGRKVDKSTVDWWAEQAKESPEAAKVLKRSASDATMAQAHDLIADYVTKHHWIADNKAKIWSRGMIDSRWVQSLYGDTFAQLKPEYKRYTHDDKTHPFPWWRWRDVRTALEIYTGYPNGHIFKPAGMPGYGNFIAHHALCDACLDWCRFQMAGEAAANGLDDVPF